MTGTHKCFRFLLSLGIVFMPLSGSIGADAELQGLKVALEKVEISGDRYPAELPKRAGNNYVNGEIINLPVGNTEVVANMIQKLTGGDVFRIDTVKRYPESYQETTEVAKEELRRNARPEISGKVDNMADYNVIYLGYPN